MTLDQELYAEMKADMEQIQSEFTEEEIRSAVELLRTLNEIPTPDAWQKLIRESVAAFVLKLDPDTIPADLLKDETVRHLADLIRAGDTEQAKETAMQMNAGTFRRLRESVQETETDEKLTRYENVPIKDLTDFVTYTIFTKQAPSGTYTKSWRNGKKTLARIDFDLELSAALDRAGVYERIINASVYTLMKSTKSKAVRGSQLYRIMTNDPDAKLTPRAIENIVHGFAALTGINVKYMEMTTFYDTDTPRTDIYGPIFKYDYIAIDRKADGTPKDFTIYMRELPLTGLYAERLNQLTERPFGYYQLPRGKKATKKNLSLNYELLRKVDAATKKATQPLNLDALLKDCGFDTKDRDETKKARDLIDEILKGREDTADNPNRTTHPERIIPNFAGYEWTTDRQNGKKSHIQIHTTAELNTGKKGDALPLNTGKKGDAPRRNTGKKGDAV